MAKGLLKLLAHLHIGFGGEFSAVTTAGTGTLVQAGQGEAILVTIGTAGAAGSTVQLFDGPANAATPVQIGPTIDGTKTGTFWILRAFGTNGPVSTQGLYIVMASAGAFPTVEVATG